MHQVSQIQPWPCYMQGKQELTITGRCEALQVCKARGFTKFDALQPSETESSGPKRADSVFTTTSEARPFKRDGESNSGHSDGEFNVTVSLPNTERRFQDVDISKILVIEVFAGTGRLTSALRDRGFRTMAIDKDKSRSKQVHIVQYDLEKPHQLAALLSLLEKERDAVLWVHFAPSCGTASRSRERPLRHLERQGFEVPKPLRSDEHPLGLPGLFGKDLAKVLSANETYNAMLKVCVLCLSLGIAISIENPGNSLFWKIPFIVAFLEKNPGFDAMFHHCVHGGLRDKLTRWWSDRVCDGQHVHAKWNPEVKDGKIIYPTHEAAYPMLLCKRLADIAFQQAINQGAIFVENLQEQIYYCTSFLDQHAASRKEIQATGI